MFSESTVYKSCITHTLFFIKKCAQHTQVNVIVEIFDLSIGNVSEIY